MQFGALPGREEIATQGRNEVGLVKQQHADIRDNAFFQTRIGCAGHATVALRHKISMKLIPFKK